MKYDLNRTTSHQFLVAGLPVTVIVQDATDDLGGNGYRTTVTLQGGGDGGQTCRLDAEAIGDWEAAGLAEAMEIAARIIRARAN